MATEWISAARALEILRTAFEDEEAKETLVRRAGASDIPTLAQRWESSEQMREDFPVPLEFWQSPWLEWLGWSTGDFQKPRDQANYDRAYGVRFDRLSVLKLVPIELRGDAALVGSIAKNPLFVTAKEARRLVYESGANPVSAGSTILEYCKTGHIHAAALQMLFSSRSENGPWDKEESEWEIPTSFWSDFMGPRTGFSHWESGVFGGRCSKLSGSYWIRLTGVYFVRSSLAVILGDFAGTEKKEVASRDDVDDRAHLPDLPEASLRTWWGRKEPVADSLTQDELWALIRAAFPGHKIARDRIRALSPGRKRGPKPISEKRSAE